MVDKAYTTGPTIDSRFEFRSFGRNFIDIAEHMVKCADPAQPVRERHSDEIYILSSANEINNIKIRYGLMDIKTLVQTVDGLEQWNPLMKMEFPISSTNLTHGVFSALQVQPPELPHTEYTLAEFLAMVTAHDQLRVVNVSKHRFGYRVHGVMCETANIIIDGMKVATVAVESTDIKAVKKTILELGLEGVENINYLQAIKRMIGLSDKPLAN